MYLYGAAQAARCLRQGTHCLHIMDADDQIMGNSLFQSIGRHLPHNENRGLDAFLAQRQPFA